MLDLYSFFDGMSKPLLRDVHAKAYGKKGQNIVDMNCAAVDAGVNSVHKVEVPAEWADAEGDIPKVLAEGRDQKHTDYINNVLKPTNGMYGDDVPVSVFL